MKANIGHSEGASGIAALIKIAFGDRARFVPLSTYLWQTTRHWRD